MQSQEPVIQSFDFFVETTDNVFIHVHRKVGTAANKVPVLLIHGTWCDGRIWDFPGRSVIDYLAVRGYDVYALDVRGMGSSDHPENYFTIDIISRVQDAVAVAGYIVAHAGRAPVVMGWSQGGVVTGLLAASAPHLVAGIGFFRTRQWLLCAAPNRPCAAEGYRERRRPLCAHLRSDLCIGVWN